MGTDTESESGRPSCWPGGPEQGPGRAAEAGRARRHGDRHDVRYTDQERSTSNDQVSTLNGGDRKGIPDMGTDTVSGIPDMGTDTMSDIPIRNVQRETFNSQLLTG
jgi:hypothetical protein